MHALLRRIYNELSGGVPLAVVTIATQEGSTPRTAGSKMLVSENGLLDGTVGGGLSEALAIEKARAVLFSGESSLLHFDMSGELAAGADMICGGKLAFLVERFNPDAATLRLLQGLQERLAQGKRSLLLSSTRGLPRRMLLCPEDAGGPIFSGLEAHGDSTVPADSTNQSSAFLSSASLNEAIQGGATAKGARVLLLDGQEYLLEPCQAPSRLFIAGGGHVSRPTVQLAASAGFCVTVIDDRPEFADPARFPWAAQSSVIPEFTECFSRSVVGAELDSDSYIVIVTRGHAYDAAVLAQALSSGAGYIGMIGSRRKRDAVYAKLSAQGFPQLMLERVHCPIGLNIGAETPEEIAVSIVGELIAVRAGKRGDKKALRINSCRDELSVTGKSVGANMPDTAPESAAGSEGLDKHAGTGKFV